MAKVVHFEIHATEPQHAVNFFSRVFGWKFNKWGEDEYYLTESGPEDEPGIEGAIMKGNHPVQPIVNTIQVEDIDAAINSIENNGGEIVVPKQNIPGVGTHCYFKDPSGYIHGVMEPEIGNEE